MIFLVAHPDDWLEKINLHQKYCLNLVADHPSETKIFMHDELHATNTEGWALVRLVEGMAGIKIGTNRLFVLEAGDCWLGSLNQEVQWYQEGAAKIEIWSWESIDPALILKISQGFEGPIIDLIINNKFTVSTDDYLHEFRSYKAGEVIIQEGAHADSVYTLVQGSASILKDGVRIGEAREGEILGLQALLLKQTRTASVVADSYCSAITISYENFQNLMENRPDLVISSMETMAAQLERLNQLALKSGLGQK